MMQEDVKQNPIEKFFDLFSRMQYDRAREFLDNNQRSSIYTQIIWNSLISSLLQLINHEQNYFTMPYVGKKFFQKEGSLKDSYTQLRNDYLKYQNDSCGPLPINEDATPYEIAHALYAFSSLRISLIEFYSSLPTKEWKAYEEMNIESLLTSANKLKNFACICEKELNSLAYIKEIYCSIVNCKILDALISLKKLRELLENWYQSIDPCALPKQPQTFFLTFTKRSKNTTKMSLLHFFAQIQNKLLNKFSLYFSDLLISYAPMGDGNQFANVINSNSLLQSFHTFYRKNSVYFIGIIADPTKISLDSDEFDYAKSIPPSFQKVKNEKHFLLPLFLYPRDKRMLDTYYEKLILIYELWTNVNFSETKTQYRYEKNNSQTYYLTPIDPGICLIIMFERKIPERDANVYAFNTESLLNLRIPFKP